MQGDILVKSIKSLTLIKENSKAVQFNVQTIGDITVEIINGYVSRSFRSKTKLMRTKNVIHGNEVIKPNVYNFFTSILEMEGRIDIGLL